MVHSTRRDILKGAAGTALLPLLAGPAWAVAPGTRYAVIGGGVAGAYAAWRLAASRPGAQVHLFEAGGRIGGRLRSIAFPEAPHLIGEAGGMRFLQSQAHVWNLVEHLKLPHRPAPVELPENRLFLRGKNIALKERGKVLLPYDVPPPEQDPDAAFLRGIVKIVPEAPTMTPAKWKAMRATYGFEGRLLRDWSTWALLARVFTWEEITFFQDSSGYDDFDLYGNGLGFFDYVFLGDDESKPFHDIVGGYDRLPRTLAAEAAKRGATIARNTRLTSLRSNGATFRLGFEGASGTRSEAEFDTVILALPQRAIQLIADFPARAAFAPLLDAVVPVTACKAFLLYPKPWWTALGITAGRSITDLPARQFYLFGSEAERTGDEPANGHGLLMAYCDATTVDYWKCLVPPPAPAAQGLSWLSGSSMLAEEIHREAGLVFNTAPPAPLAACLQDWSADPFGAGWHFWKPGRDGRVDATAMLKPLADKNLYVCGEAWSLDQGWVEGALERTETLLQTHLGVPPPRWLKA